MKQQENSTIDLIETLDALKAYFANIMTDVVSAYGDDEQQQQEGA